MSLRLGDVRGGARTQRQCDVTVAAGEVHIVGWCASISPLEC